MKQWVMSTQDFRTLLETEQDFRCALTGFELTPETVTIAHRTPLKKGGKHIRSNVYLVHESVAKLVRDHSADEVLAICRAVISYTAKENMNG